MPQEIAYTPATHECPHPERWTSRDMYATEFEVIAGIVGLVRMIQPSYVVETGSYVGDASLAIGQAIQANGHGVLDTIEILPKIAEIARKRTAHLGCVNVHTMNSLDFTPSTQIDLLFLDSGGQTERIEEFRKWYADYLHARTIVAIHDTAPHHWMIRAGVEKLVAEGLLQVVFFPTPRGVVFGRVLK